MSKMKKKLIKQKKEYLMGMDYGSKDYEVAVLFEKQKDGSLKMIGEKVRVPK